MQPILLETSLEKGEVYRFRQKIEIDFPDGHDYNGVLYDYGANVFANVDIPAIFVEAKDNGGGRYAEFRIVQHDYRLVDSMENMEPSTLSIPLKYSEKFKDHYIEFLDFFIEKFDSNQQIDTIFLDNLEILKIQNGNCERRKSSS